MTTAIPTRCVGCGGTLSSTAFYEDGKPYHFGCRPSQQVVIVGSDAQREHADLRARIAEMEADRARKAEAISDLVDRAEQAEAKLVALKEYADDGDEKVRELEAMLRLALSHIRPECLEKLVADLRAHVRANINDDGSPRQSCGHDRNSDCRCEG